MQDCSEITGLHLAAFLGEAVTALLNRFDQFHQFDQTDKGDWYFRTPITYAAEMGHESILQQLLNTNIVNIYSEDTCNKSPLSHAILNGHASTF